MVAHHSRLRPPWVAIRACARHIGTHAAIAQDEVGQHRKDRLACGALNAPDGEPAQANPSIMGVAGQTPAAGAGRFMGELKAQGQEKGEDKFDKCLAIVHQLQVGGWLLKIDRDGTVLAGRFERSVPCLILG